MERRKTVWNSWISSLLNISLSGCNGTLKRSHIMHSNSMDEEKARIKTKNKFQNIDIFQKIKKIQSQIFWIQFCPRAPSIFGLRYRAVRSDKVVAYQYIHDDQYTFTFILFFMQWKSFWRLWQQNENSSNRKEKKYAYLLKISAINTPSSLSVHYLFKLFV